jgi:hypothetical protein
MQKAVNKEKKDKKPEIQESEKLFNKNHGSLFKADNKESDKGIFFIITVPVDVPVEKEIVHKPSETGQQNKNIKIAKKEIKNLTKRVNEDENLIVTLEKEISEILNKNHNLSSELHHLLVENKKMQAEDKNINKKLNAEETTIKNLKNSLEKEKNILNDKINREDKKFNAHEQQSRNNLAIISQEMSKNENNLRHALKVQENGIKNLETKVKTDSLVSHIINTDKAKIKNLDSNDLHLGKKLRLTENSLTVPENFELQFGNEKVSISELVGSARLVRNLTSKCGMNLEKCKIVSNELLQETRNKEENILNSLKEIKAKAYEIASHRIR